MPLFKTQAKISKDPIVGLMQKASRDTSPSKFTAIVGCAADDTGKLIIPEAVTETARRILDNGIDMSYAPTPGIAGLADAFAKEILGEQCVNNLKANGIFQSQVITSAGTNAITVAVQACTTDQDPIITHDPHWAGYDSIMLSLDREELVNFQFLDKDNNFNFLSFETTLDTIVKTNPQARLTIILNTPFDNPLGKDFGSGTWDKIGKILSKYSSNEILLILDIAYIDFGPKGKDYSRLDFLPQLFRSINNQAFNVVIAGTASKSFAMYGARVGVAILLSSSELNTSAWSDVAGGCIRGTFSNSNHFGQEIIKRILADKALITNIHEFQFKTAQLLAKRKNFFISEIKGKLSDEFKLIEPDSGFFICLKIDDKAFAQTFYNKLLENHCYIPLISDHYLRIPVCGLSEQQLQLCTQKLTEINKQVFASK